MIAAHGIARLVDVRRFPGSRRHPQFGQERLAGALAAVGVEYAHEEELGGRRAASGADAGASINRGWRNASFRAYADHMASPAFRAALERLLASAAERPSAVMCAEAVPWRCHRQLIADAAVARGWRVLHVLSAARADAHTLREEARVLPDRTVVYPGPEPIQRELL
jgi:uncharacterized protein (DUF488 family)